jgi:hypothetical protein
MVAVAGALILVTSVVGLAGVAGADTLTLNGTDEIPNTLSVTVASGSGTYAYQWYDCPGPVAASMSTTPPSGCSAISGATSASYALVAGDYAQYVTVGVTDGTTTYYATADGPILEPAPTVNASLGSFAVSAPNTDVNTTASAPAVVDGFTVYNQTGVTYQWYDCAGPVAASATPPSGCTSISGATAGTYTLAPGDVGSYVLVEETATNAVGSASAYAASTTSAVTGGALVPNTTSSTDWPSLSLAPSSLAVSLTSPGIWTGSPAATSYAVSWYRCSSAVPDASVTLSGACAASPVATSPGSLAGPWTYSFSSADIGTYLVAGVSAVNGFPSSAIYYSPSSAVVEPVAPRPTSYASLSGSAVVGGSVSVSPGTWSGLPTPTVVGDAWHACSSNPSWSTTGQASTPPALPASCSPIPGATSSTFSPTSAQSGEWLIAQVEAANSAGTYYVLPASLAVTPATTSTQGAVGIATPNVNGVDHATLTTPFNGSPSPTVTDAWYDCASAVAASSAPTSTFPISCGSAVGAGSSYGPTSADLGRYLVVVATATSPGVPTLYANSASLLLTGAPAAFSGVTLAGAGATTPLGTTMTAAPSFTATPAPTPSQTSYQWYSCTGALDAGAALPATGCAAIPGATGASYAPDTLASATNFTGSGTNNVLVRVTINNGLGASSDDSATTQLTTAVPTNTVAPSLSTTTASTATPLTARNGTWLGAPTPTLTAAWYYCTAPVASVSTSLSSACHPIGVTGPSYQPTGSLVGDYFLVGVTAHNGVGGGTLSDLTLYSASTSLPLVSSLAITALTVSGTATVGSALRAVATVSAITTYTTTYQWYECATPVTAGFAVPPTCTAIPGATAATVVVTSNQAGYYLSVDETVTGDNTTATALAASTPLVTTNAPGSPTHVVAVAGVGSASVSWSAPTTGLAPTSYRVVATNGATCTSVTTSCVVTGLLYGTYYTFTVTATNAAGTSPASLVSNPITPSESVPGAPTRVVAVAGEGSARVSWSPALANGSLVTLYVVTALPGGATCSTAGTSCLVTGLTNGLTYALRVTARNALGTGASSAPVAVTPRVASPPAPVGVVVRRASDALIVAWSAGLANGVAVRGYVVSVSGGGTTRTCATTATTCTVSGLVNGVAYRVVVSARGASSAAETVVRALVAPAGHPSAPVVFHSARGRGVVIVYVHPPTALNGAPVAYYQYLLTGTLLRGRWTVQPIKGRTVIVLRGLRLATAYVVRVRAVSVGGASPASRPVRVVTL